MELKHPGMYIQQELIRRGRTQKEFAKILGKRVSEVNELIKGKRKITMQWDFLLCALFDSPEKTWITIQMDFDYNKEKTSLDIQKIHDIHQRKEEYEGRRTRVLQEEVIDEEEKLSPKKDEEKDEPILQKSHRENPIEKGKKSSTIQDTNEDSKNTKQEALSSTKIEEKQENGENKRKGHEIFRNF